jgi:hypothetical protein
MLCTALGSSRAPGLNSQGYASPAILLIIKIEGEENSSSQEEGEGRREALGGSGGEIQKKRTLDHQQAGRASLLIRARHAPPERIARSDDDTIQHANVDKREDGLEDVCQCFVCA